MKKVLSVVLALVMMLSAVSMMAVAKTEADCTMTIGETKTVYLPGAVYDDFVIVTTTDLHFSDDNAQNRKVVEYFTRHIKEVKPDLVILTGDQIQGYSHCYRTDTYNKVKKVIAEYTAPMEKRGIPFTITFGNHDDDCVTGKAAQLEIYAGAKCCVMGESHSQDDPGTHFLNIKDSDGEKDIFALYLIDSNKKEPDGAYSPVRPEQLRWLE
jgi:predicted MPP superfamily phosphohydrolase